LSKQEFRDGSPTIPPNKFFCVRRNGRQLHSHKSLKRIFDGKMGCDCPGEPYLTQFEQDSIKFELGPAYEDVRARLNQWAHHTP
jgi:hypothetical protein